ncbi:hypothetical protein HZF05_13935 [Sphingomonas sp. CGMCC 1.13654]|uniref:Uncharacterized protein n=1 Tax=Sphingomonas chungangi TaxID=2683589 RepID=A0A838LAM8_9SPHN|nr:hypothetical protein [Sphingomonas chungangi]MBA2935186.1 hypothetical protein [Sphingomonas chungangi]MVW55264.1 hypothetical protein [Sphingomonas chungangi]
MIVIVAVVAAILVTVLLTIGPVARSETWRATVTPLASIIGSGFLICGPLLAHEFGSAAFGAMTVLLLLAYAVGAVIRFNIVHVEALSETIATHDPMAWAMRAAQGMLGVAYAVSVAYYLKLLAEFTLKRLPVPDALHATVANAMVTAIILMFVALTFSGSLRRIEHAAHASVSAKIGVIAGLLAGLAIWWAHHAGSIQPLPPAKLSPASIPMLLGLLITVQGFETSRYLGDSYSRTVRVRTMRLAQGISSVIYLAFIGLLTPFLGQASQAQGVAGILDIMTFVAPILGIFVLIGAVASQLSAAIADSIGAGGLVVEVSRRKLGVRGAFITVCALAIAVVWLTDPFQVVALASRAFALFYAMQAGLALWASLRTGAGGWTTRSGFIAIGLICLVAAAVGAPAEG